MPRPLAVGLLVLTTIIWGCAFVAQKWGMASMGPFTFAGVRYIVGGLLVLPIATWEWRRRTGRPITAAQWRLIAVICAVFFLGSVLQQTGLRYTTVTNSGFLTGLYAFFTPVFGYVIYRLRPHPVVLVCVPLALGGLYLLNGGHLDRFTVGDLLIAACAAMWGVHVLLLGRVSLDTGLPITISALSFLAAGLAALPLAFLFETPSLVSIAAGWPSLAYAAVLSTAIAFCLQAVAQQYVPPANAAIILSSESLFAALAAAVLLGERLPPIGYVGAAMMFAATVAVELVPALQRPRTSVLNHPS